MGIQSKKYIIKPNRSFNRDKYIKNIGEIIVKTYNTDKNTAMIAINRSGLNRSLDYSPELTTHISDEDWANKIWMGYKKSILNLK